MITSINRIILPLVLFLPLLVATASGQKGYPRTLFVTFERSPVYDSASYLSDVIVELHVGDTVTALGVEKKFVHVMVCGREGYVLGVNLAAAMPGARRGSASEPESSDASPSPEPSERSTRGSSKRTPSTPEPVAQQCHATTKKGARCKRTTTDPSGYCWQHQR